MDHLRQAVIEEAKTWLGTPFATHAMVKGAGVACGPLLIAVYGAVGIAVPQLEDLQDGFSFDWHLHTTEERYLNVIQKFTQPVEVPQPGDIAMFSMGRNRPYSHSAIIVAWPTVIHALWDRNTEWADASQPPLNKPNRSVLFLSPFKQ